MASAHSYLRFTQSMDRPEELAETWHDITLDSYIVDIRRVKKPKNTVMQKALQKFVNMPSSLAIYQWKILSMLF